MPASWPAGIPQYLTIAGNQEGTANGLLRSQTDTGPAKIRRRSSSVPRPLAGSMIMTDAQRDTLVAFVATDIADGALPFTLPQSGGVGTWLVRFTGLPTYTNLGGGHWSAAFSLEILQ